MKAQTAFVVPGIMRKLIVIVGVCGKTFGAGLPFAMVMAVVETVGLRSARLAFRLVRLTVFVPAGVGTAAVNVDILVAAEH